MRALVPALVVFAMAAPAQAATLLTVPVGGGAPTVVARDPGAYIGPLCWRADGALRARVERRRGARYGTFRTGQRVRWHTLDDDVFAAEFAPGCTLLAEEYYAFSDDKQYGGGLLVRDAAGRELMRLQSDGWPEDLEFVWSRDGSRLAVPGAQLKRLIQPDRDVGPPVWSPDGTALAVTRRG